MYYDTYRGKRRDDRRRSRRRRGCLGWLLGSLMKLILLVLVLAIFALALLFAIPPSFMNIETGDAELSLTDGLPNNRLNILLLGLDFLQDAHQRSDTMIVASIGDGSLRLASILRDTVVDIPGHSSNKINAAYAMGGPDMAMRVVNETFDLNITNYVAVDFKALVDLVDAVGGVDVEVEAHELEQLNKYAYNTYKKISAAEPEKYAHYAASQPITQTGKLRLNGLYATSFARIRKVEGYDYARTERQREVILAVIDRIKEQIANPGMYTELFRVYQESVQTNMSLPELISVAEKALLSDSFKTGRFPNSAHILDDGSSITITNPAANVAAMHEFIYGDNPPQPEATVKISAAPTAIPSANFEPLPQL